MSPRVCLDCGERLRGRSDKKFCSDQCRNNYNNRVNREQNSYVRNIQNLLRRNRKILADLYEGDLLKVHRDALIVSGFSFGFFTQMVEPEDGSTYWYCYEYGISELDDDYLRIVLHPNIQGEF